jgi:hypothetical protein
VPQGCRATKEFQALGCRAGATPSRPQFRRHAQPGEHGWLSGVRYQGHQIAVVTLTVLNETHVFSAAEARALSEEIRARICGDVLA